MTWMDAAGCGGNEGWLDLPEETQVALCHGCPVRFECLNFALDFERPHAGCVEDHPVYGGLTGPERKQILDRQRRKSEARDSDFPTAVEDRVYLVGVA